MFIQPQARQRQGAAMRTGLHFAIALSTWTAAAASAAEPAPETPASSASYGPQVPAPAKPVKPAPAAAERCDRPAPSTDSTQIVICAQRPQGYRIDPDVMAARRAMRDIKRGNRPKPPERLVDQSCKTVGPMGCPQAGINILAAAATAAAIIEKAAKGENVGKMFVTDPQPTEYQLYLEAKHRREAEEKAKALEAKVKAAKAARIAAEAAAKAEKPDPK